MLIAIGIILVLAIIFGPQYWVKHVLKKYSQNQEHFPGTGGELAQHLIEKYQLHGVKVEKTEVGDHYDPIDKVVRLSHDYYDGKSLTAIAVAAHEVGHAIQHNNGYLPFELRQRIVSIAIGAEKLGAIAMIALPFVSMLARSPHLAMIMFFVAIASMLIGTLVHFITLPVEWDASFKRALPILKEGEYISDREIKYADKILTAAALTYVSGSLASLLNMGRWIAILRR